MEVTIPQPVLVSVIGLILVQAIAFAGFQIRQLLQNNATAKKVDELVKFKEAIEAADMMEAKDLTDIKTQQAVQKEQTAMILTALGKLEAKVDTLIEKVAKQDGRSGRSS